MIAQVQDWSGPLPAGDELVVSLAGGWFVTEQNVGGGAYELHLRSVADPSVIVDTGTVPGSLPVNGGDNRTRHRNARGDSYVAVPTTGSDTLVRLTQSGGVLTITTVTASMHPSTIGTQWVAGDGSQVGVYVSETSPNPNFYVYDTTDGSLAYSHYHATTSVLGMPRRDRYVIKNGTDIELRDETATVLDSIAYPSPGGLAESWQDVGTGGIAAVWIDAADPVVLYVNRLDTVGDVLAWALPTWTQVTTDWVDYEAADAACSTWGASMVMGPSNGYPAASRNWSLYWINPASGALASSSVSYALSNDCYDIGLCGPDATIVHSYELDWTAWTSPAATGGSGYLRQRQSPRQSIRVDNDLLLRQRQRWI